MGADRLLALASPALADELHGLMVGITNGDTFTLLTPERREVKIRLAEIDTPESRQPYGTRTRQALLDLAFRRDVRVEAQDTGGYGRTVGRIYAGRVDVNAEIVRRGAAWVYRRYSHDPSLLVLEDEARQARRGI
jgi:endonuclease YncB( thermonuclease family)